MQFIVNMLRNNQNQKLYIAYNGLRKRKQYLDGKGLGDKIEMKKILLRRMIDSNLGKLAGGWRLLVQNLKRYQRNQEQKRQKMTNITKRMEDSNLRLLGGGLRLLLNNWKGKEQREKLKR